jgi:anthranilate/para-aminobenzoate synthase component II
MQMNEKDDEFFGDGHADDQAHESDVVDPTGFDQINNGDASEYVRNAANITEDDQDHDPLSADFNLHSNEEQFGFGNVDGMGAEQQAMYADAGHQSPGATEKKPLWKQTEVILAICLGLPAIGGYFAYKTGAFSGDTTQVAQVERIESTAPVAEQTVGDDEYDSQPYNETALPYDPTMGTGEAPTAIQPDQLAADQYPPDTSAQMAQPIEQSQPAPVYEQNQPTPTEAPVAITQPQAAPTTMASVSPTTAAPAMSSGEIEALKQQHLFEMEKKDAQHALEIEQLKASLAKAQAAQPTTKTVVEGISQSRYNAVVAERNKLKSQLAATAELKAKNEQLTKYSKEMYAELQLVAQGKQSKLVDKLRSEGSTAATPGAAPMVVAARPSKPIGAPPSSTSEMRLKGVTPDVAIIEMNGQDVYMRVGTTEKGVTLRGIDTANAVVSTSLGMLGRGR